MTNMIDYVKNVAKSIAYSTADQLSETAESSKAFVTTNREIVTEVYESMKDLRKLSKRITGYVKGSKVYEAANEGIKAAFEDIKTGKFYNKERIAKFEERALGSMADFGEDEFDIAWEEGADQANKSSSSDNLDDFNLENLEESVVMSSKDNAEAISTTVARVGAASISASKANTMLLYDQQIKTNSIMEKGFSSIFDRIGEVNKVNFDLASTHADNSARFFESTTKLLTEQNSLLQQIIENQKTAAGVMAEQERKSRSQRVEYRDVIGHNGELDVKSYAKSIKQNFMDAIPDEFKQLTNMKIGGEGSNILLTYASSPLQFLTNAVAKKIIPKIAKKAVSDLDKTISGSISGILANFNYMQQDEDNVLKKFIGDVFGVKQTRINTPNTSNYNKGPMPWNGMAQKSLIEVIPGYLRRIESLLSGQGERIYKWSEGKWTSGREFNQYIKDQHGSETKSAYRDVRSQMTDLLKKSAFFTEDQWKDLNDDMDRFLTYIVEKRYGNPRFRKEIDAEKYYTYGVRNEETMRLLIDAFQASSRESRSQLSKRSFEARDKKANSLNNLFSDTIEMLESINDSNIDEGYTWDKKRNKFTKTPGLLRNGAIDKILDDQGHNVFWYLQRMYTEMALFRASGYGAGTPVIPSTANTPPTPPSNISPTPASPNVITSTSSPKNKGRVARFRRVEQVPTYTNPYIVDLPESFPDDNQERLRERQNAESIIKRDEKKAQEAINKGLIIFNPNDMASYKNIGDKMKELHNKKYGDGTYESYISSSELRTYLDTSDSLFSDANSERESKSRRRETIDEIDKRIREAGKAAATDRQSDKEYKESYGFFDRMRAAQDITERMAVFTNSVDNILNAPQKFLTNIILKADERIYGMVFGDGETHYVNGEPVNGIMGEIHYQLKTTFDKFHKWVDENIFKKFTDKGIHGFGDMFQKIGEFFNVDIKGSAKKLKEDASNVISGALNSAKDAGKSVANFISGGAKSKTNNQETSAQYTGNKNFDYKDLIQLYNVISDKFNLNRESAANKIYEIGNFINSAKLNDIDATDIATGKYFIDDDFIKEFAKNHPEFKNLTSRKSLKLDRSINEYNEIVRLLLEEANSDSNVAKRANKLKEDIGLHVRENFFGNNINYDLLSYLTANENLKPLLARAVSFNETAGLRSRFGDNNTIFTGKRKEDKRNIEKRNRISELNDFIKILTEAKASLSDHKNISIDDIESFINNNPNIDSATLSAYIESEYVNNLSFAQYDEIKRLFKLKTGEDLDIAKLLTPDEDGDILLENPKLQIFIDYINSAVNKNKKNIVDPTKENILNIANKKFAQYSADDLHNILGIDMSDPNETISTLLEKFIQERDAIDSFANGTRYVTKTGLTTIHEGEMVIPSELNPFNPNRGKVSKSTEIANENRIKNKFLSRLSKSIGRHSEGTSSYSAKSDNKMSGTSAESISLDAQHYQKFEDEDGNIVYRIRYGKDDFWSQLTLTKRQVIENNLSVDPNVKDVPIGVKGGKRKKIAIREDGEEFEVSTIQDIVKQKTSLIMKGLGVEKQYNEAKSAVEKYGTAGLGGGLIGAGAGLGLSALTGLAGGPIIGAIVGAVGNIATKSEKLNKFLFGEEIGDDRVGGIISSELQEGFKKYAPSMLKIGLGGALAGALTPLGPIGGAIIGSTIGFIKKNDDFQDAFFGEDGIFSKEDKEKFKKEIAPRMGLGAGLGAAAGLITGGPFGILGGALLGTATGFLSTTDTFKNLVLGKEYDTGKVDKDGNPIIKRSGGIVGTIKKLTVEPVKEGVDYLKVNFKTFMQKDIIDPLKRGFKPLAQMARNTVKGLKDIVSDAFNNVFEERFGFTLKQVGDIINDKIVTPIANSAKKIIKFPIKLLADTVSAPFKLFGFLGDTARSKMIEKGMDIGSTAAERLAWRDTHPFRGRKRFKNFNFSTGTIDDGYRTVDEKLIDYSDNNLNKLINDITKLRAFNSSSKEAGSNMIKGIKDAISARFDTTAQAKIYHALKKEDYKLVYRLIRNLNTRDGKRMPVEEANALISNIEERLNEYNTFKAGKELSEDEANDIRERLRGLGFFEDKVKRNILGATKSRDFDLEKISNILTSERQGRKKDNIWSLDDDATDSITGNLTESVDIQTKMSKGITSIADSLDAMLKLMVSGDRAGIYNLLKERAATNQGDKSRYDKITNTLAKTTTNNSRIAASERQKNVERKVEATKRLKNKIGEQTRKIENSKGEIEEVRIPGFSDNDLSKLISNGVDITNPITVYALEEITNIKREYNHKNIPLKCVEAICNINDYNKIDHCVEFIKYVGSINIKVIKTLANLSTKKYKKIKLIYGLITSARSKNDALSNSAIKALSNPSTWSTILSTDTAVLKTLINKLSNSDDIIKRKYSIIDIINNPELLYKPVNRAYGGYVNNKELAVISKDELIIDPDDIATYAEGNILNDNELAKLLGLSVTPIDTDDTRIETYRQLGIANTFDDFFTRGVRSDNSKLRKKDKLNIISSIRKFKEYDNALGALNINENSTDEAKTKAKDILKNQENILSDIKTYLSYNVTNDGDVVRKLISKKGEVYVNKLDPKNRKGLKEGANDNENNRFLKTISEGISNIKYTLFDKPIAKDGSSFITTAGDFLVGLGKKAIAGILLSGVANAVIEKIFGKEWSDKLTENAGAIGTKIATSVSDKIHSVLEKIDLGQIVTNAFMGIGSILNSAGTFLLQNIPAIAEGLGRGVWNVGQIAVKALPSFAKGLYEGAEELTGLNGRNNSYNLGEWWLRDAGRSLTKAALGGNTIRATNWNLPTLPGKIVSKTTNATTKAGSWATTRLNRLNGLSIKQSNIDTSNIDNIFSSISKVNKGLAINDLKTAVDVVDKSNRKELMKIFKNIGDDESVLNVAKTVLKDDNLESKNLWNTLSKTDPNDLKSIATTLLDNADNSAAAIVTRNTAKVTGSEITEKGLKNLTRKEVQTIAKNSLNEVQNKYISSAVKEASEKITTDIFTDKTAYKKAISEITEKTVNGGLKAELNAVNDKITKSGLSGLLEKAFKKFGDFFADKASAKAIECAIDKSTRESLGKGFKNNAKKLGAELAERITKSAATETVQSGLGALTAGVATLVFLVADLIIPIANPADTMEILGISSVPTVGQKIFAGVINAFWNALPWVSLIPINYIVGVFTDQEWLGQYLGDGLANIIRDRKATDLVLEEFKKETGVDLTSYELNRLNGYKTAWDGTIGKLTDNLFGTTDEDYERLKRDIASRLSQNGMEFDESLFDKYSNFTINSDGTVNLGGKTLGKNETNIVAEATANIEEATILQSENVSTINSSVSNIALSLYNIEQMILSLFTGGNITAGYGAGSGRYSQRDKSINMRFNKPGDSVYQDINTSGCGPIAATNLINRHIKTGMGLIEPHDAAKYALSHGYKETNGGTDPRYFRDYFGRNGISSTITSDRKKIRTAINNGQQVVLMGKDPHYGLGNTPYGPNPHYVVATGMSGDNIIIDNPEEFNEYTAYDAKDTLRQSNKAIITNSKYGMGTVVVTDDSVKEHFFSQANNGHFIDTIDKYTKLKESLNTSLNYDKTAVTDTVIRINDSLIDELFSPHSNKYDKKTAIDSFNANNNKYLKLPIGWGDGDFYEYLSYYMNTLLSGLNTYKTYSFVKKLFSGGSTSEINAIKANIKSFINNDLTSYMNNPNSYTDNSGIINIANKTTNGILDKNNAGNLSGFLNNIIHIITSFARNNLFAKAYNDIYAKETDLGLFSTRHSSTRLAKKFVQTDTMNNYIKNYVLPRAKNIASGGKLLSIHRSDPKDIFISPYENSVSWDGTGVYNSSIPMFMSILDMMMSEETDKTWKNNNISIYRNNPYSHTIANRLNLFGSGLTSDELEFKNVVEKASGKDNIYRSISPNILPLLYKGIISNLVPYDNISTFNLSDYLNKTENSKLFNFLKEHGIIYPNNKVIVPSKQYFYKDKKYSSNIFYQIMKLFKNIDPKDYDSISSDNIGNVEKFYSGIAANNPAIKDYKSSLAGASIYWANDYANIEDFINETNDGFNLRQIIQKNIVDKPPYSKTKKIANTATRLGSVLEVLFELYNNGEINNISDYLRDNSSNNVLRGHIFTKNDTNYLNKILNTILNSTITASLLNLPDEYKNKSIRDIISKNSNNINLSAIVKFKELVDNLNSWYNSESSTILNNYLYGTRYDDIVFPGLTTQTLVKSDTGYTTPEDIISNLTELIASPNSEITLSGITDEYNAYMKNLVRDKEIENITKSDLTPAQKFYALPEKLREKVMSSVLFINDPDGNHMIGKSPYEYIRRAFSGIGLMPEQMFANLFLGPDNIEEGYGIDYRKKYYVSDSVVKSVDKYITDDMMKKYNPNRFHISVTPTGLAESINNVGRFINNAYTGTDNVFKPLYNYMYLKQENGKPVTNKYLTNLLTLSNEDILAEIYGTTDKSIYGVKHKDIDEKGNPIIPSGITEYPAIAFEDLSIFSEVKVGDLNNYIANFYLANGKSSPCPFKAKGSVFYNMAKKYGVNPRFVLAVIATECSLGNDANGVHYKKANYGSFMVNGQTGATGMHDFTISDYTIGNVTLSKCSSENDIECAIENMFKFFAEVSFKSPRNQKTVFAMNFKDGYSYSGGILNWVSSVCAEMLKFPENTKATYIHPDDAQLAYFRKVEKISYNTDTLPKNDKSPTSVISSALLKIARGIWGDGIMSLFNLGDGSNKSDDKNLTLKLGNFTSARDAFSMALTDDDRNPTYSGVSSEFGPRALDGASQHMGIDLTSTIGTKTKIYSPIGGTVLSTVTGAGNTWPGGPASYGNTVLIQDDETGNVHMFAHMRDIAVKKNDKISISDYLGHMGNTGYSTGPHLHYGVAIPDVNNPSELKHVYYNPPEEGTSKNGKPWSNASNYKSSKYGWIDPDAYMNTYMEAVADRTVTSDDATTGQGSGKKSATEILLTEGLNKINRESNVGGGQESIRLDSSAASTVKSGVTNARSKNRNVGGASDNNSELQTLKEISGILTSINNNTAKSNTFLAAFLKAVQSGEISANSSMFDNIIYALSGNNSTNKELDDATNTLLSTMTNIVRQ